MDKKKAMLWILFSVVFLDLLGFGLVIPIFAPLFINPSYGLLPLDYSYETRAVLLGLFLGSYAMMMFFSTPILGALSDKHGRKKLLIFSLAGTVVGYLIIGAGVFTKNVWLMFAGRILDGITGGNISIAQAAIADLSDEKSKAKNFGLIGMAFGLGFIIGPFLGGKLSDPNVVSWFNTATPFWFTAAFSLCALLLLAWRFEETLEKKNERIKIDAFTGLRNVAKGLAMRNLRVMFAVLMLFAFGFTFFNQFFQVFLIKRFSFTPAQIGDFFAFFGLCAALTQGVIVRWVSPRFPPESVLSKSLLGISLCMAATLLVPQAWGLYLLVPLLSVFQGLSFPNTTALMSNLAGKESQGEILGISTSIQSLGMALPPLVAGLIAALDYTFPVLAASLLMLLAWAVFVFSFKPSLKQAFHEA
ncbi:MAG: MFS transporter [Candidatus Norongarragalinales archaeon]